jgi:hypothetical protein
VAVKYIPKFVPTNVNVPPDVATELLIEVIAGAAYDILRLLIPVATTPPIVKVAIGKLVPTTAALVHVIRVSLTIIQPESTFDGDGPMVTLIADDAIVDGPNDEPVNVSDVPPTVANPVDGNIDCTFGVAYDKLDPYVVDNTPTPNDILIDLPVNAGVVHVIRVC